MKSRKIEAMNISKPFRLTDLFRSIALGILLGWLIVSIQDPHHKRFEFTLTDSGTLSQESIG